MKDLLKFNDKHELNGYQEIYIKSSGKLRTRGNWKKNRTVNYSEWHYYRETIYFIR